MRDRPPGEGARGEGGRAGMFAGERGSAAEKREKLWDRGARRVLKLNLVVGPRRRGVSRRIGRGVRGRFGGMRRGQRNTTISWWRTGINNTNNQLNNRLWWGIGINNTINQLSVCEAKYKVKRSEIKHKRSEIKHEAKRSEIMNRSKLSLYFVILELQFQSNI